MSKKILATGIFLAAGILSGCALTPDHIDLKYSPQQGVSKMPEAANVAVNVKVIDQRQDKNKVSTKKNGYGMEMAPILANEDVAITVRKAIEQELSARGFQMGADTALVQITADLIRFYNDHKVGFFSGNAVADLNMSVSVKSKDGTLLYAHQVIAQGTEANTQLMSGENARLALDRALVNGMQSLFDDKAFLSALISASAPKLVSK